jgi:DNA-binding PadR family transcriptional regulator
MTSGRRRGRRGPMHGFGPGGASFGRKARRGDIRAAILALLAEEPMHGYQIIQELAARTDDVWRPSPGSVYPTLQQLEDEGLVSGADQDGRRTFALTDAGRAAAAALPEVGPWARRGRGDDLRGLARELGIAAVQVSRVASPAALDEARTILTDARKALYRILADDQPADDQPVSDQPSSDQPAG